MLKVPYRFLCLFLLSQCAVAADSVAPVELLFTVTTSSPTIPADSYSTTCSINSTGRVDITRSTILFNSRTVFKSTESKKVSLTTATLRTAINEVAKSHVTGSPLVGGGTHQYFAYQTKAKGQAKEILLLDKKGGMFNDSPLVKPLTKFIDDICGDVTQ